MLYLPASYRDIVAIILLTSTAFILGCSDREEEAFQHAKKKSETKKRELPAKLPPPEELPQFDESSQPEKFPVGKSVKIYDSGNRIIESKIFHFFIPENGEYFKNSDSLLPYVEPPHDGFVKVSVRILKERKTFVIRRLRVEDGEEIEEDIKIDKKKLKNDDPGTASFEVKKGDALLFKADDTYDADNKAEYEEFEKIDKPLKWGQFKISHLVVEFTRQ